MSEEFLARKLPELLPERGAVAARPAPRRLPHREPRQAQGSRGDEATARRADAAATRSGRAHSSSRRTPRSSPTSPRRAPTDTQGKEWTPRSTWATTWRHSSTARSPAANAGVVVFAAPLTIYGNAVMLDHGLGLQTLYGHLSRIEVKEGDEVKKGQELGRAAATGLAVGDHLHYEVLIHGRLGHPGRVVGRQVDPRPHRQPAPRGQYPAAAVRPARRRERRRGESTRARSLAAPPRPRPLTPGVTVLALRPFTRERTKRLPV